VASHRRRPFSGCNYQPLLEAKPDSDRSTRTSPGSFASSLGNFFHESRRQLSFALSSGSPPDNY
ncbi:hypothetical protein JMJ77_0003052, partial [Colletotrichum scovillei]